MGSYLDHASNKCATLTSFSNPVLSLLIKLSFESNLCCLGKKEKEGKLGKTIWLSLMTKLFFFTT